MSIVSIKDLLNAGVHFGHQQRFWNPKMESYIFDTRKKISIIDLEITQECLNAAASKAEEICSKGNRILFVGTKRSASKTIKESASELGLPYVDKRWLGGTLTNWKTIRGSIRRLLDIEELQSSGRINKLSKKENVDISKEYAKLEASVGGIKEMKGLPDALFVVDIAYEKIAVTEAKKMGIPIIALVDTNSDPISGRTAEATVNDADTLLIYDASATAVRKMTRANFASGLGGISMGKAIAAAIVFG